MKNNKTIIKSVSDYNFHRIIKYLDEYYTDAVEMIRYFDISFEKLFNIKLSDISEYGVFIDKLCHWPDRHPDHVKLKERIIHLVRNIRIYADKDIFFFRQYQYQLKTTIEILQSFNRGIEFFERKQVLLNRIKKENLRLPSFLVLGVPKSATTWLYYCLKAHPQIFIAEQKELEFFNSYRYFSGKDKYAENFKGVKSDIAKATGEVSINNFQSMEAPIRISQALDPESVKLIVLLREPVSRAISHYKHMLFKGRAPKTFDQAVCMPYFWSHWIDKGHYSIYYDNYMNYFRKSQIHIALFENINADPIKELKKIFRFLNVDPDFISDIFYKRINCKNSIRNIELLYLLERTGSVLQTILPKGGNAAYKALMTLNTRVNLGKSRLSVNVSDELLLKLRKKFIESNKRLAESANIDLSVWDC